MFFILRKTYDVKERRELLLSLFEIFDVEGIDSEKLMKGLKNETFSDFEDCLQMECAESFCAQYIVTRNTADYVNNCIQGFPVLLKCYSDGIFGIGTVAAAFTMGKGIVLMGKLLDKKFAFVSVLSPERP